MKDAPGLLAAFLPAVKSASGKILSCKDQETPCAPLCVCVLAKAAQRHNHQRRHLCGGVSIFFFFSTQVSTCVLLSVALSQHGQWIGKHAHAQLEFIQIRQKMRNVDKAPALSDCS